MVCDRCIMVVNNVFDDLDIPVKDVKLGEVETIDAIDDEQRSVLDERLAHLGFELLSDKKSILIDKIKNAIIDYVHYADIEKSENLSSYIQHKVNRDYSSLSSIFHSDQGVTIEQYAIQQRIERVKELLLFNQLNMNEISYQLGYSSVNHLSAQFKKVTGLTPTQFKKQANQRKPLDKV